MQVDPLTVACPRCQVPVGTACVSSTGKPTPSAHSGRYEDARTLLKDELAQLWLLTDDLYTLAEELLSENPDLRPYADEKGMARYREMKEQR